MSLNDIVNEREQVDVNDNLERAVKDLSEMSRKIEHLSVTSVGVVESLENNEHDLHWSDVDAAKMVWETLDEMVDNHKSAVQLVDEVRRDLEQ